MAMSNTLSNLTDSKKMEWWVNIQKERHIYCTGIHYKHLVKTWFLFLFFTCTKKEKQAYIDHIKVEKKVYKKDESENSPTPPPRPKLGKFAVRAVSSLVWIIQSLSINNNCGSWLLTIFWYFGATLNRPNCVFLISGPGTAQNSIWKFVEDICKEKLHVSGLKLLHEW